MTKPLPKFILASATPGFWRVVQLGVFCALVGLLGAAVGPVADLEIGPGLTLLFQLRGPRTPPPSVILISLDRQSAEALQIDPRRLHRWPRGLHGQLLDRLSAAQADVVVFDVHFHEPRDSRQDQELAAAMSRAQNVVLLEYVQQTGADSFLIHERLPPLPLFADAALGSGTFTLPKGESVRQFWLFKKGAGDAPSLPVVALHAQLQRHLAANGIPQPLAINEWIGKLRNQQSHLPLIPTGERENNSTEHLDTLLAAVASLYRGPDSRYLDFYGPPTTIPVMSYLQALEDPGDLRGKVVFVGYLEQPFETSQVDSFITPFPSQDGVEASGAEIAATAFANLLEQRFPTPPPAWVYILLLIIWGLLGATLYFLPATYAVPGAALLASLYLGLATTLFSAYALWLPIVVPLMIQLPLALLGALLLRYLERQRLHAHLGLFTTPELSQRAATGEEILRESRWIFGVCLSSDATHFTSRAETLDAPRLHALLNSYYGRLFPQVEAHGGRVSDVIGDEMLAIWDRPVDNQVLRRQALTAALAMAEQLGGPDAAIAEGHFPTKFGLHCGQIVVGSVGAKSHFEYRAVGDVVNTATRIQSLNKQLGTTILASAAMLMDLQAFSVRSLGYFRLVGRREALEIFEIRHPENAWPEPLVQGFNDALRAFQSGDLDGAGALFGNLVQEFRDGPSAFYRNYCCAKSHLPSSSDWDGTVALSQK